MKNGRSKTITFGTKPDPNKELKQWKTKKQPRPIPVKVSVLLGYWFFQSNCIIANISVTQISELIISFLRRVV